MNKREEANNNNKKKKEKHTKNEEEEADEEQSTTRQTYEEREGQDIHETNRGRIIRRIIIINEEANKGSNT